MSHALHILDKLRAYPQDLFDAYIPSLLEALPGKPAYLVGYGSCLSQTTQSKTSVPDFYVVVRDYASFYTSRKAMWLNKRLVPNIYHVNIHEQVVKYCVISIQDLQRETSEHARDLYHIGRFSKRVALVHAQDDEAPAHLALVHTQAMHMAARLSLELHPEAQTREDRIKNALRLSYEGDVRIEAADKVDKLYAAESAYYMEAYAPYFDEVSKSPSGLAPYWIRTSRIRARMRWIKNIVTASSWIDYMIFKIKRTQGIEIQWTDNQKKFWFIHIWPLIIKFQREKRIQ